MTGHIPAEDPHHGALLCLNVGKEVRSLSMVVSVDPDGRGHFSAGTSTSRCSTPKM